MPEPTKQDMERARKGCPECGGMGMNEIPLYPEAPSGLYKTILTPCRTCDRTTALITEAREEELERCLDHVRAESRDCGCSGRIERAIRGESHD